MLKKYKIPIIFTLITIATFIIILISKVNSDLVWNFGYAYNTANGKLMYRDFNMVISPFYPAITGLLMAILGKNMLSFSIINTFYAMIVIYIVYKINPKIYLLATPFLINACIANYNTFGILFTLLLIYLEKEKKNDYLIGFIIGLAFLTKINVGVLLAIPSLYYFKDFKKIFKRFAGFLIPNVITILVFLLFRNLKNYISYVFLGVLDFASNNFQFHPMAYVIPVLAIVLIIFFIKEKNIFYLYVLFFMGLIYPVMNEMHVIIAATPALIILMNRFDKYIYILRYVSIFYIAIPVCGNILNYKYMDYTYDQNIFKFRPIQREYIKNKEILANYFQDYYDDVCFLLYDNYLYKYLLDIPINKYDVILYGNLGYKGTEKMMNYLDNLDCEYFVLDGVITGAQYNMQIIKWVHEHATLDTMIDNFYIFKRR